MIGIGTGLKMLIPYNYTKYKIGGKAERKIGGRVLGTYPACTVPWRGYLTSMCVCV
jgi:hypothetical protein